MPITQFTRFDTLKESSVFANMKASIREWTEDNFFQSPEFLEFIESIPGFRPLLLVCTGEDGTYQGSLLAVAQSEGKGLKSWFSRRMIVLGGPAFAPGPETQQAATAEQLLKALKKKARGKAIYIEFRNYYDTAPLRQAFESSGFRFVEHLNLLVTIDDDESVQKRMGRDRRRQIRTSLKTGAEVREAETEEEVRAFYDILETLYREKVKKPLPDFELFRQFWKSPHAKIFIVTYDGKILGGAAGPVYQNKVIYQWYLCGDNGSVKGLHTSVLATWGQIDFGLKNGYSQFDFMGAGKPDKDYGVRKFKASFGCEEVAYGRYELILSPWLYEFGKFGLKIYSKYFS